MRNLKTYIIQVEDHESRGEKEARRLLRSMGISLDPAYRVRIGVPGSHKYVLRGSASEEAARRAEAAGFQMFPDLEVAVAKEATAFGVM